MKYSQHVDVFKPISPLNVRTSTKHKSAEEGYLPDFGGQSVPELRSQSARDTYRRESDVDSQAIDYTEHKSRPAKGIDILKVDEHHASGKYNLIYFNLNRA